VGQKEARLNNNRGMRKRKGKGDESPHLWERELTRRAQQGGGKGGGKNCQEVKAGWAVRRGIWRKGPRRWVNGGKDAKGGSLVTEQPVADGRKLREKMLKGKLNSRGKNQKKY